MTNGSNEVSVADSRRPLPFTEFIVKIHQRCNLACRYCYMYEMADQSWQSRPTKMPAETFAVAADRIAEHVDRHDLAEIDVMFHGGEPFLRGVEFMVWATNLVRGLMPDRLVRVHVQTNGTLLTSAGLLKLSQLNMSVGVSLDGDRRANDRYRLTVKDKSSFDSAVEGLRLLSLPAFRPMFRGILATIDIRNPPVETFDFLASFDPPMIDFLLPHANWESPPSSYGQAEPAPYGRWLAQVFDHWLEVGSPVQIRYLHNIMVSLLGGASEVETIGLTPPRMVVIDTDGSLGQVDSLKSAYAGAAETGIDIFTDSLDAALYHPDVVGRQMGVQSLGSQCRSCELVRVCGGGYYPHRYSAGSFSHPSVYCADLQFLIDHISASIGEPVPSLS